MHVMLFMAAAEDEKIFLRAAVDSIPKEIVCGFSPEDQSGALDAAERRFVKAARDYGTEISTRFAYLRSCGFCADR
jgi:hypothetical protein